jgi:hypothetical protein
MPFTYLPFVVIAGSDPQSHAKPKFPFWVRTKSDGVELARKFWAFKMPFPFYKNEINK